MKLQNLRGAFGVTLLLTSAFVLLGCGQSAPEPVKVTAKTRTEVAGKTADHADEWWCEEHGIPEHMCGLCDAKYRAAEKAKGDWCEIHQRLKSQCFKCDPTLYERIFEPKYVEKFGGKKPTRPPASEFTK
jgi:hypothetical protein